MKFKKKIVCSKKCRRLLSSANMSFSLKENLKTIDQLQFVFQITLKAFNKILGAVKKMYLRERIQERNTNCRYFATQTKLNVKEKLTSDKARMGHLKCTRLIQYD